MKDFILLKQVLKNLKKLYVYAPKTLKQFEIMSTKTSLKLLSVSLLDVDGVVVFSVEGGGRVGPGSTEEYDRVNQRQLHVFKWLF